MPAEDQLTSPQSTHQENEPPPSALTNFEQGRRFVEKRELIVGYHSGFTCREELPVPDRYNPLVIFAKSEFEKKEKDAIIAGIHKRYPDERGWDRLSEQEQYLIAFEASADIRKPFPGQYRARRIAEFGGVFAILDEVVTNPFKIGLDEPGRERLAKRALGILGEGNAQGLFSEGNLDDLRIVIHNMLETLGKTAPSQRLLGVYVLPKLAKQVDEGR